MADRNIESRLRLRACRLWTFQKAADYEERLIAGSWVDAHLATMDDWRALLSYLGSERPRLQRAIAAVERLERRFANELALFDTWKAAGDTVLNSITAGKGGL